LNVLRQPLPEPEPLGRLIGATRRRIKQAVVRRLGRHPLSPQQFWVLANIYESPGLSLRDLADRLRTDQPTASRIVAALSRRKWVLVQRDPRDRRRRSLGLTLPGRALAEEVYPLAREVRVAIEAGFSPAELVALRGFLGRIMGNLDRFDLEEREAAQAEHAGKPG
jgi:DNA-binding MarR family transcriptional regulator